MTQVAALLAGLILAGLICFQLLLAAGLPLGHYAWGGERHRSCRVGGPGSQRRLGLAGFFGIDVVMNAISRSVKERRMALVALSLGALSAVVALGL